ncbi:1027_t:CDS:2 [Ambispora leptoticha]|uniref:1027_t:CDS:1 n=1 Tax=Ambispora leptoticha TaxID=144679 RepID=A0A9N8VNU2_9GLOM|nr:1027_t:CDS:2 [Ambispora leptoticha]
MVPYLRKIEFIPFLPEPTYCIQKNVAKQLIESRPNHLTHQQLCLDVFVRLKPTTISDDTPSQGILFGVREEGLDRGLVIQVKGFIPYISSSSDLVSTIAKYMNWNGQTVLGWFASPAADVFLYCDPASIASAYFSSVQKAMLKVIAANYARQHPESCAIFQDLIGIVIGGPTVSANINSVNPLPSSSSTSLPSSNDNFCTIAQAFVSTPTLNQVLNRFQTLTDEIKGDISIINHEIVTENTTPVIDGLSLLAAAVSSTTTGDNNSNKQKKKSNVFDEESVHQLGDLNSVWRYDQATTSEILNKPRYRRASTNDIADSRNLRTRYNKSDSQNGIGKKRKDVEGSTSDSTILDTPSEQRINLALNAITYHLKTHTQEKIDLYEKSCREYEMLLDILEGLGNPEGDDVLVKRLELTLNNGQRSRKASVIPWDHIPKQDTITPLSEGDGGGSCCEGERIKEEKLINESQEIASINTKDIIMDLTVQRKKNEEISEPELVLMNRNCHVNTNNNLEVINDDEGEADKEVKIEEDKVTDESNSIAPKEDNNPNGNCVGAEASLSSTEDGEIEDDEAGNNATTKPPLEIAPSIDCKSTSNFSLASTRKGNTNSSLFSSNGNTTNFLSSHLNNTDYESRQLEKSNPPNRSPGWAWDDEEIG